MIRMQNFSLSLPAQGAEYMKNTLKETSYKAKYKEGKCMPKIIFESSWSHTHI